LGLTFYLEVGHLRNLSVTLKQNFIWFNSSTLEILSIALMSNRRKEWESFCVEVIFFTENEGTPNIEILKNGQSHKLGDVSASLFINNPLVCKPLNFFLAT
jgi:hypothetical protein